MRVAVLALAGALAIVSQCFGGEQGPPAAAGGPSQPYYIWPRTGAQHVSLAGEWDLGWRDAAVRQLSELDAGAEWFRATVPGSVHWALHRTGKLPHPYEGLNSRQYQWVDEKVWYYRKSFHVPAPASGGFALLVFDGIDYYARVWLNGTLLGEHEGMFGGPALEVSKLLKPGAANEVVVEVRAGNWGRKATWKSRELGTVIKPWVLASGTGAEAFFTLGMWRAARLELVPATHLERPFLVTESASAEDATLSLTVEVLAGTHSLGRSLHPWDNRQLDNPSDSARFPAQPRLSGGTTLRVDLTPVGETRAVVHEEWPLDLLEGRNWVTRKIKVARPKLWWPNGLGESARYTVSLTLVEKGTVRDGVTFTSGIRTVTTEPSVGPRTGDRWADWQFVVNGRRLFVKGVNWMPADLLLDLPRDRYRWLLGLAKAAGIQMVRIWGAGLLETEEFYDVANELGIMVWQDFPIGNQDTPDWPQPVWEAQVVQNIFRLRNHPALVLYCGGNEFNPYSLGNAATIGILERSLATFDPTRPFRRTSPDEGSVHTYPDMDPTWYAGRYRHVPFMAETGMHNIPESMREVVSAAEFKAPLSEMYSEGFAQGHPDFIHHFAEYSPSRVPRMLSRASHIDDMSAPALDALAEASQVGAGEFYQIVSDGLQGNFPVTTGLLPWVFKRPWPVVAIMLVDGFGHPTAPFYFLKRTYEPTHVAVQLPHLIWAPGETLPARAQVMHAGASPLSGLRLSVAVLDDGLRETWRQERPVDVSPGASVANVDLGSYAIPASYGDRFLFVVAELKRRDGTLVSRSVYWPRVLARMSDPAFRDEYRREPKPALTLDKGPWLKRSAAATRTTLEISIASPMRTDRDTARLAIRIRNAGTAPAVNTRIDVTGRPRSFHATDNYFWLAPGEERRIDIEVLWRGSGGEQPPAVEVGAWNAAPQRATIGGQ